MQLLVSLLVLTVLSFPATAADISGRVTVIDGDTIAVEGTTERIRLYGVDAPGRQQTCETAAGHRYLCGSNFAQFLADLVGRNGRVTCVEDTRDRYGRIVAECTMSDGTAISEAMVRGGWAVHYTRYSDGRYQASEDHARGNRLGMWASFMNPLIGRTTGSLKFQSCRSMRIHFACYSPRNLAQGVKSNRHLTCFDNPKRSVRAQTP